MNPWSSPTGADHAFIESVIDDIVAALAAGNTELAGTYIRHFPEIGERLLLAYHLRRGAEREQQAGRALADFFRREAQYEWDGGADIADIFEEGT